MVFCEGVVAVNRDVCENFSVTLTNVFNVVINVFDVVPLVFCFCDVVINSVFVLAVDTFPT